MAGGRVGGEAACVGAHSGAAAHGELDVAPAEGARDGGLLKINKQSTKIQQRVTTVRTTP